MPSRRLALFFAFALAAPALAVAQKPDKKDRTPKAETFESAEGRFTVKAAGKELTETKQIAYGPRPEQYLTRTLTKWDGPQPGTAGTVSVTYADYPETFRGLDAKVLLDGARDGVRGPEGLGGTVTFDKPHEFDGPDGAAKFAGREVVVKARKNFIRVRLVLVDLRLYQVMVTGTEDAVAAEGAKAFLDSFTLTK